MRRIGKWLLILILALISSMFIEILQLALVRGLAELDDLFSNTLGAILGICSYELLRKPVGNRLFEIMCAAIQGIFVIICLSVFIIGREPYTLKDSNLSRAFCFQIDEAATHGKELTLRGFAFGYDRHQTKPRLVLCQTETGSKINTDIIYGAARPDVNDYFLCDYDYTNVGFTASGIVDPKAEYEIMISWPLTKLVTTGVYVSGADVHRVAYRKTYGEEKTASGKEDGRSDNDRLKMPDLPNAFVTDGTLLVYRPDIHIWIFQYDGSLYWIADEGFNFEDDGNTHITFRLWTTQKQKLPADRLKKKLFWDNLGRIFEKQELTGDFGKYRVMRHELPTEYSITSILTGYYKNREWVWAKSFRPVYEFSNTP